MRLALSWLFSLASKSATGVPANLFSPQLLQVQGGSLLLQGLPQPGPGGAQHQVLGLPLRQQEVGRGGHGDQRQRLSMLKL